MERDQWLKGLKERADRSVLHDVVFSPEMEENIRRTIKQEAGRKKGPFPRGDGAFGPRQQPLSCCLLS